MSETIADEENDERFASWLHLLHGSTFIIVGWISSVACFMTLLVVDMLFYSVNLRNDSDWSIEDV